MSNDGGSTVLIEQKMADALEALKVFKTADIWKYQVSVDQGGISAFQAFAPYAFTKFEPPTDSSREGDGDLNQHLRFAVMLGQTSKERGDARIGNAKTPGISKLRDIVIDLFNDWHPGEGFDCDDFKYDGEELDVEGAFVYCLTVYFKANRITI